MWTPVRTVTSLFLLISFLVGQPSAASEKSNCVDAPAKDDKVLVALLYTKSCKKWCEKVLPIVRELEQTYGDRVQFEEFDLSPDKKKEAHKRAESLRICGFVVDSEGWVPIVGFFTGRRKLVRELCGTKKKEVYVSAVQQALIANEARL